MMRTGNGQFGFWRTLFYGFAAGIGWRLAGLLWRLLKWPLLLLAMAYFPQFAKFFAAM